MLCSFELAILMKLFRHSLKHKIRLLRNDKVPAFRIVFGAGKVTSPGPVKHKKARAFYCSRRRNITGDRKLLGFDSGQSLHQAALAARSVVFVDNAFFSSFIEAADGFDNGGLIGFAGIDGGASFTHGSASGATEGAVAQTLLFVLAVALDLRFDISQGVSSEKMIPRARY
jgi:hypothetical protein